MARIRFIEYNGTEHEVDARPGESVMLAAINNGVPGIDADCGGACSCGTCHVFLEPRWLDVAGEPGEYEEPMLDMNPDRRPGSRLACQITVSAALDGMVVRLPQFQF